MYTNTRTSLLVTGAIIFSSITTNLAYADVVINGNLITDASIRDPQNAQAVMDYIKDNPGTAAYLLKNNPSTLDAVCSVYRLSRTECQKIVDDTVVSTPPQDTVVVGNQAYTNEWITRNKENMDAVVKYVTEHPSDAATILQNASQSTRDAVLRAVNNGKTGTNLVTTDQANQWIKQNSTIPVYTGTSSALGSTNYPDIYNKIRTGDLTIGTRIGDTITITNKQVKDFFATNPTPQDLIKYAADKRMTTSQVAEALTIGKGLAYDPIAMLNYIRDYPGYALGPDNIIVKLQPGQTKRASDGMLEGTWSSDPGHVSYTEWARAWYCAGNGDVNGGKVDYGRGATTAQCDNNTGVVVSGTTGNTTTTTTVGTSTNPYKSSLSVSAQNKLNTWISTKITVRSTSLTPTNYSKFVEAVITKLNTIKSTTPTSSKNKLNTIGYLVYELQQIRDSIDDSDSFLDDLFN